MALTLIAAISYLLCALLAYFICLALYRVTIHPLARIPGPKLAAISTCYEFYFDCLSNGGGKFYFKIAELHKHYGPVVRISPNEVHINDPAYYNVLYSAVTKFDKDAFFYAGLGSGAVVGTASHERHRPRRRAMDVFFSAARVRSYEPLVLSKIAKLASRLKQYKHTNEVMPLGRAFRCLAQDVVTQFATPDAKDLLSEPDFALDVNRALRDFSVLLMWRRHIPIIEQLVKLMTAVMQPYLDPESTMGKMLAQQAGFLRQAEIAVARGGKVEKETKPSIVDVIVSSPFLDEHDKQAWRLSDEVKTLVGAGTETTGSTLSTLFYHALANPEILARLKKEINNAAVAKTTTTTSQDGVDGLLDHKTLASLPFLHACIQEALRLACPVTGRLPRSHPTKTLTYTTPDNKTTFIFPPGTVLSMSMADLHFNASAYPDPHSFEPERWLHPTPEMEQAFVPFGRGTRICIGKDVAQQEIVLAAGNLLHKFDFELYETGPEDLAFVHDHFAPFPAKGSQGLRVRVK